MAGGTDLYMRIMLSANSGNAVAIIGDVARSLGGGAGLLGGLSLLNFGFSSLGTTGIKSWSAIRDGAVQAGDALWKIVGIATLVGGVIAVAIGVLAVRAAADFQQGLNRLVTGAGDVTDNMQKMGFAILGISVATGVLTGELLPAMYQIISAGQRGAQAENTLAVAAKGSVVEQANVVDVAKALTTAMTDYGTKVYNATQFMNGYTRATQLGKITLEELSTTMGPILPLAQNLGIHFADVAGAMSTMTNAGIPAARAATSLRFLFQSLENPTHKASVAMQNFGLDSIKLANELKVSLPGALQMVYDAAKKAGPEGSVPFNRAVSDMIGGQRSLQAYLALTGTHLATFKSNTIAIKAAMDASKTSVLGWSTAQGNFNLQMSRAHAAVQATLITIGQQLLPVLTRLLAYLVPIIASFGQWLVSSGVLQGAINFLVGAITNMVTIISAVNTFLTHNAVAMAIFKAALIVLAIIIATLMVAALFAWAAAAWTAAAGMIALTWPALLVLAVIILVVAGIVLAVQHWGAIMDWITGKTEQLRIAHEQKMVQMRITADNQTIMMAHKVIANYELQRQGILAKLKATHDPAEKMELTHQLKMLDMQIKGQTSRLNAAEADKQAQLKKAAELHAQMLEAQKWFGARFFDMVVVWTGNVFSAIGTWTHNVLATILAWFGNIMSALGTFVQNFLTTIGQWRDQTVAKAQSLVDGVFNWIKSIPGRLASLAGTLIQAGLQIVENIASGIISGIGSFLGNAMSAVGSFISSHLPHSPAKLGPLKDLDKQAKMISEQIAAGIIAGSPAIQAAMTRSLTPVSVGVTAVHGPSGATSTHSSGPITVNLTVNTQQFDQREADRIASVLADKLRAQMGNV